MLNYVENMIFYMTGVRCFTMYEPKEN